MDKVLSVFLLGLSYGLVLFLVATGLSMTMGLMRIVNMAHGALFMAGGFVGLTVAQHSNFLFGALAAIAVAGLGGFLLEVGFLRRLYKQEASQVLLTIGFIYILVNIAQWIWGSFPKSGATPGFLSSSITIGAVDVATYRLFIIGFGLVMAVLLWLFQDKTKVGAKVRAGMDSRETASQLGINLKLLFTGIFALGSLLAGLAGFMGGKIIGTNLNNAWQGLLLSLIVVVIGGAGSVQGALIGGIILGLLNSFGAAYFPSFSSYIMYVALIVILLVRPSGLLGQEVLPRRERGAGARVGLRGEAGQEDQGGATRGLSGDSGAETAEEVPALRGRAGAPGGRPTVRRELHSKHVHQGVDLRDLRHEPRSHHGLHRPALLRSRRLLRHGRVRLRDPDPEDRHHQLLAGVHHHARPLRSPRGGDRLPLAAGVGGLLPAGHHGLRATPVRHRQQVDVAHRGQGRSAGSVQARPGLGHPVVAPEVLLLRADSVHRLLLHPVQDRPLLVRQDPHRGPGERAAHEEPGIQHLGGEVHGHHPRGHLRGRGRGRCSPSSTGRWCPTTSPCRCRPCPC